MSGFGVIREAPAFIGWAKRDFGWRGWLAVAGGDTRAQAARNLVDALAAEGGAGLAVVLPRGEQPAADHPQARRYGNSVVAEGGVDRRTA